MQHTDQHALREHYDSWHRHWADHEDQFSTAPLEHPWHQTVAPFLKKWAHGKVLEIGCGRGDFAAWIARECAASEVVGVDFSEAAIQTARRRAAGIPSLRFEVGDALDLPFDKWEFDCVVSCECLEHVLNPAKMASEICRVLRPMGRFVLTTENYFNAMSIAWLKAKVTKQPFDSGSSAQPHENYFLYWRVKQILQQSGLVVTKMQSNHFQWLLLPKIAPAALCTEAFARPALNRLFRPFGRHFTFSGHRY